MKFYRQRVKSSDTNYYTYYYVLLNDKNAAEVTCTTETDAYTTDYKGLYLNIASTDNPNHIESDLKALNVMNKNDLKELVNLFRDNTQLIFDKVQEFMSYLDSIDNCLVNYSRSNNLSSLANHLASFCKFMYNNNVPYLKEETTNLYENTLINLYKINGSTLIKADSSRKLTNENAILSLMGYDINLLKADANSLCYILKTIKSDSLSDTDIEDLLESLLILTLDIFNGK